MRTLLLLAALGALTACGGTEPRGAREEPERKNDMAVNTYGADLAFLGEHQEVLELTDASGKARVALVPGYQGRVMTSTSGGKDGPSYGWLNREAIASNERKPHINVFGGEDRFWLGPEGGQFSIFFKKGDPFDLDHWQTPEPVDWGAWAKVEADATHARFRREISLVNYSGAAFSLEADRTIHLLGSSEAADRLGVSLAPDTEVVAYESLNAIKNTGDASWSRETGLLSIWILGMYNPSPKTTVVIPFVAGSEAELGPVVNDAYFGKVPADRLVVKENVLFFRGDGTYRSKIGIPRKRARAVMGSYDGQSVLTLVQYQLPEDATAYVNSMWEIQKEPFLGDVANSYNDGPPAPGANPLGPFYELESSSPAAELAPGGILTHVHRTFHIRGPQASLDAIARATLGVSLQDVGSAFE
jgi:Family of unknown function (DUF6786)